MARTEREREKGSTVESDELDLVWRRKRRHADWCFVRNKYASPPQGGREIGAGLIRTGAQNGRLAATESAVAIFERPTFRYKLDRKWLFTSSGPLVNVHASPARVLGHPVTRPSPLCPRPRLTLLALRSHPYLLVARAVAVKRPPVSPDNVYWKIYSNIFN